MHIIGTYNCEQCPAQSCKGTIGKMLIRLHLQEAGGVAFTGVNHKLNMSKPKLWYV